MDPQDTSGELQYLRMRAVSGAIPTDPFLLRLSVEKFIGGPIYGAFKENKGISYVLKIRSQAQFDKLLRMNKLADGTNVVIEEHTTLNQVKCVVSNADTIGLEENYIAEQLNGQRVKEVRRIKRRNGNTGILENTPTLILTISGTVVPEHIDFGWSRCRTRPYYPSPMQCFRCWTFGHTGKRCTAPAKVCGRCSQIHPEDQAPNPTPEEGATALPQQRRTCTLPACCKTCNNSPQHALSSRECPAYKRENAIQVIRVDQGISYPQARREFEAREAAAQRDQNRNSYAGVTSNSKDVQIAELQAMVKKLENDAVKREKRMTDLEAALQNRPLETRLEAAKTHGPVEELIRQVAELTATVKQLQEDLRTKDSIIAELQKQQLTPKNSTNANAITETPMTLPPSTNSQDSYRLTIQDPKVADQVAAWIQTNGPGSTNTAQKTTEGTTAKKTKKPKTKKKVSSEPAPAKNHSLLSRQGNREEGTDQEMMTDSDNSIGTVASSAAGSKRAHALSSSGAETSNSSKNTRTTRNRKKVPRETGSKTTTD